MSPLEKTFYGLLLIIVLSFGGVIYSNTLGRITTLEVQSLERDKENKARVILDQVVITELKADLRYMRLSMERIESKLDLPPTPPKGR